MKKNHEIEISTANSARSREWKAKTFDWNDLRDRLMEHKVGEKDGISFCPAKLSGSSRKKENIESLSLMAFDYDGGVTEEGLREAIKEAGFECVVHSTHSHGKKDEDHFRVVIPLKEPFVCKGNVETDEAQWKSIYRTVGKSIGLEFDSCGGDINRLFYLPRHPENPPKRSVSWHQEGEFLDLDKITPEELVEVQKEDQHTEWKPDPFKIGDRYSAKAIAEEVLTILARHGWRLSRVDDSHYHVVRPGKGPKDNPSATIRRDNSIFHCFSTNAAPFEAGESYSAFAVRGLLDFNGDFSATAKTLHAEESGESKPHDTNAEHSNMFVVTPEAIQCSELGIVKPPERDLLWAGNGGFARGIVGILAGQGGCGKSMLSLQLAMSLASGVDCLNGLFSLPEELKTVLAVFAEDDHDEVNRRAWTIRQTFPEVDTKRLSTISRSGDSALLKRDFSGNLIRTDGYNDLLRLITKIQPDLIILDPLGKMAGPAQIDSNNSEASAFLNTLETLIDASDGSVLGIHHVSKASVSDKGSGKRPNTMEDVIAALENSLAATAVRGASALTDNARWGAVMTMLPESCRTAIGSESGKHVAAFKVSKSNYSPCTETKFIHRIDGNGPLVPFTPVDPFQAVVEEQKKTIVLKLTEIDELISKTAFVRKHYKELGLTQKKATDLVEDLVAEEKIGSVQAEKNGQHIFAL